ncbi:uncharacterized protein isoform X2 [Leptinotarsa decemlineata]|uniref:uncharacterized protein isoform X2 n=1 Tax=Leptinotarsa decemlineata TaxID=7539 RepID=UPI003D305984
MISFVETSSLAASLIALFSLVFVIIFNLYILRRNGFCVNANCWFCNAWTKVPYRNRNSFDCPSCLQYNGFDKDGGYNKVIEAQHNTSFTELNTTKKTEPYTNGLCTYCNNNQQLKVYQLAQFTPINEETYDKEVEHFQKQLDKSYKLCKKCDKVLKSTIEKKNAWIFGNRLKNLRKKGLSILDLTKSSHGLTKDVKQSFCLKVIKYTLVSFTVLVLCQILNVKIDYPTQDVQKYMPKSITQYEFILRDIYSTIFNVSRRLDDEINNFNSYLPKNIKIQKGNLLPITSVGFLLDFIILLCDKTSVFSKINGMLGWTVLFLSSSISFRQDYFFFINILQVFTSLSLLYSYLTYESIKKKKKIGGTKFQFKKIKKPIEVLESSDEEEVEEIQNSSESSTKSKNSYKSSKSLHYQSVRSSSPVQHFSSPIRHNGDLNHSFTTAKMSSSNRPILSPPKLKNITQNPWTAGGFWKNDTNVLPVAVANTNLSRSSSQSSGFVSSTEPVNNNFNSSPPSRDPSVGGDVERSSILSESAYHFKPINSSATQFLNNQQLYYKADNNTFYPVLNQNNMLFIQNGVPTHNLHSSFGSSSLRSFNTRGGGFQSPPLFIEKSPNTLFRNANTSVNERNFIRKPSF